MKTALEIHIEFANTNYTIILILCICGILFNSALLICLLRKKQIFDSVFSIYMIQIALNDLLVCLIWSVMLVMLLSEMPSADEVKQVQEDANEANTVSTNEEYETEVQFNSKFFNIYRVIYALFNLHSYINILLLAMMSIERCIAVKKSLKCQRYKFQKRVICWWSFSMWILAIVCTLPSLIDSDFITQGESSNVRIQDSAQNSLSNDVPFETLTECYKPLQEPGVIERGYVTDYKNISADSCFAYMYDFHRMYKNVTSGRKLAQAYEESAPNAHSKKIFILKSENTLSNDEHIKENKFSPKLVQVDYTAYVLLFEQCFNILNVLKKSGELDDMCKPMLLKRAKIYQIITNLIIGFFVPFLTIIWSNLFIAYHIGRHAQCRLHDKMKSLTQERTHEDIHLLQTLEHNYQKTGERNCEICQNDSKKRLVRSATFEEDNCHQNDLHNQTERPRTRSFLDFTKKRRRMSVSSVESLPTEHTTLTSGYHPILSQSVPAFLSTNTKKLARQSYLEETTLSVSPLQLFTNPHRSDSGIDLGRDKQVHRDGKTKPIAPPNQSKSDEIKPQEIQEHNKYEVKSAQKRGSSGRAYTTKTQNVVTKNAKRQKKMAYVILSYVIVFTCCWLPFKITTTFYYAEALINHTGYFCHQLWGWTRIISFFSVLLNPLLFAFTKKKFRPCTSMFRQEGNNCLNKLMNYKKIRNDRRDEIAERLQQIEQFNERNSNGNKTQHKEKREEVKLFHKDETS